MITAILPDAWTPIDAVPGLEYRYFGAQDGRTQVLLSVCVLEFRMGGYHARVPMDPAYVFRGSNKDLFEVMDYFIEDFLDSYKYSIIGRA